MVEETDEIYLNVNFFKKSNFVGKSIEDGLPVAIPLKNLEELLAWEPDDSDDPGQAFSISNVPFEGKVIPKNSTKTLVCHDMAGGYVDDRFVQGTVCSDDKWYYMVYWDIIDTFVYFSHHFVTIPPVGWINSAHRNGVAVLGTLITEYNDGYNRWKAIFSCEYLWKAVADQLVKIAQYYKFEGWLINIENKIKDPHVVAMNEFVKYLTEQMHSAAPGSQVIWYDSVTKDGVLSWQNALNEENREFFESCDGIFLNYGWTEKNLEESAKLALTMSRVQDVYVGIDVFGRGCYGGGGLNSDVALEVIRRHQLSVAIFAPGWIKEVLGSKNFEANEKLFWNSLSAYCNTHSLISDGKIRFMTNFRSGMVTTATGGHRSLRLSNQDTMPRLSDKSSPSLPLLEENSHPYVSFAVNSSCSLIKTSFELKNGFLVLCMCYDRGEAHFLQPTIVTDIGPCELKNPSNNFTILYKFIMAQNFSYSIWTIEAKTTPFVVQEVLVEVQQNAKLYSLMIANIESETETPQSFITQSELSNIEITENCIRISVKDVTWGKSEEDSKIFLFSCTLQFENIYNTMPTDVLYLCQSSLEKSKSEFRFLGTSNCSQYRINKLEVPNPMYHHGPNAKLIFKVEQKTLLGFIQPNRSGELVINYAENMKHWEETAQKAESFVILPENNNDETS